LFRKDISATARVLGISCNTIYRKLPPLKQPEAA
jgi:transcriptional regulator of acetoin/glycerol metabolism